MMCACTVHCSESCEPACCPPSRRCDCWCHRPATAEHPTYGSCHQVDLRLLSRPAEPAPPEVKKAQEKGGPRPDQNKTVSDWPVLWDADPACIHVEKDAPGGGIKCTKCSGWYCL